MGERGPLPKPVSQKKAEGTFRKDRHGEQEQQEALVPAGAPPSPAELSPEASAIWNQVVPELLAIGTLAKTDGGVLAGYCMTLARAIELDKLAKLEPVIDTPFGKKLHPAHAAATKLWPVVQRLAVDLGLSYAARSRVKMPAKAKEDKTESFLFGQPLKVLDGGRATPPPAAQPAAQNDATRRRDAAVEAAILAELAKGPGSGTALVKRASLNKSAALAACRRLFDAGSIVRNEQGFCLPVSGSDGSGTSKEPTG